ncbi:zinc finger protein 69-like [Dreissena polymorpha]|uniref:C2H2-type domain-containing protein n=1 Tax=Dreissena polymorpha TaxID=45954 RepID=A0A9D4KI73_DREPO|nr:zinc finger protein 69-like [Dreissena polymorpha]KAH3839561.1 hypothetical protein DPMN_112993 [Dreissena polymorpha]
MSEIFTVVTVILSPELVDSIPHTRLQKKLRTLRLVTGVQFSKTHALHGKWYQVDAAFEILNHWSKYPDHEPALYDSSSCNEKINLCECQHIKELVGEISKKLASEKSSGANSLIQHDSVGISINTFPVKKDIDNLKKELELSSVYNGRNTEDCNFTDKKTTAGISNNSYIKIKNKRPDIHATYVYSNVEPVQNNLDNLEQETDNHSSFTEAIAINTASLICGGTDTNCEVTKNKCSKAKHVKAKRKPGEDGYWTRVKREDNHLEHICSQCGVVLISRKRYREHVRRLHLKEYKCDVCLKGFGYPSDLKHHKCTKSTVKSKESKVTQLKPCKQPKLSCTLCKYTTSSIERLSKHFQVKHSTVHNFEESNLLFKEAKGLDQQLENVHHLNSIYVCDQCSKCYKSKVNFELHMKTHEKNYEKPHFYCTVCGKAFTTKYVLTMHNKSQHLGIKQTYLCPICGKKFSNRNSFKQHANVHSGIKPYKCDVCEKAFTYHKSLREHKFMHDNIRRFKCNTCGKTFRQRTTLHIHKRTHKLVKDHVCHCGKEFSQKQALERHERIHSGVKPFKCVHCGKAFSDSTTIRRHMIAIHLESESNWQDNIICTVQKKSDYYIIGGTGQNRKYSKSKKLGTNSALDQDMVKAFASHNGSLSICNNTPLQPVKMESLYTNTRPRENLVQATGTQMYALPGGQAIQFKAGAVININGITTYQGTNLPLLNSSLTPLPVDLPHNVNILDNQKQLSCVSSQSSSIVAIPEPCDGAKSNSCVLVQSSQQMYQSSTDRTLPVLSFNAAGQTQSVQHLVICSEENSTNLTGIVGFFQYPLHSSANNDTASSSTSLI